MAGKQRVSSRHTGFRSVPISPARRFLGAEARPDRNELGFPRHAGGASLRH